MWMRITCPLQSSRLRWPNCVAFSYTICDNALGTACLVQTFLQPFRKFCRAAEKQMEWQYTLDDQHSIFSSVHLFPPESLLAGDTGSFRIPLRSSHLLGTYTSEGFLGVTLSPRLFMGITQGVSPCLQSKLFDKLPR